MPEAIISASGVQHGLIINPDGSINTAISGGIHIGSVSANVDSVYVQSGANIDLGSAWTNVGSVVISGTVQVAGTFSADTGSESYLYGKSGADWMPLAVQSGTEAILRTTATVTVGSESVITAGSVQPYSQLGSVEIWQGTATDLVTNANITNFGDLGSAVTQGTNPWIISGVISNLSEVSVTVGSEAVVTAGSIQTYSQLGSVEIWQTTAGDLNVDIGDIGSVRAILDNPVNVGSFTTQTVDGTITVTDIATAGSLAVQTVNGSVGVHNVIGVTPSGTFNIDIDNFGNLGSAVTQGTDPWITSGTSTIAGSAYVTGSINIISELTLEDVGSPCFKQATATASGTYTQVWEIGGTGSKLEIHGFHISTNLPGYVRMLVSGTTKVEIADYNLNYASGAVIEKTFVTPIVPGGANIHTGFGTTVAGSTLVTIYGREIK